MVHLMEISLHMAFLLVFLSLKAARGSAAELNSSNLINLGSSVSPTAKPTSWKSPSGRFAFGFYQEGNGFKVGIWLEGKSSGNTVVWTAFRDDPPMSPNSTLEFTVTGKLIVRDNQSYKQKTINVGSNSDSVSTASMLDTGNLVLYNQYKKVIWESFCFPTDTILGGQQLSFGGQLDSGLSGNNHSTGLFRLVMQLDGNLVLYPETSADAYWASDTNGEPPCHLYLNNTGRLSLVNNSNSKIIKTLFGWLNSQTDRVLYRATLDYDGVFRLYSHTFDANTTGDYGTKTEWSRPDDACKVKGFCGFNSYCTLNDNEKTCLCIPGSSHSVNFRGCERDVIEQRCKGGKDDEDSYNITAMEDMMWDDPPYFRAEMSKEDCSQSCLVDCNCEVAVFNDGHCDKQKLPLRFARRVIGEKSTAFVKVSKSIPRDKTNNTTSNNTSNNGTTVVKPQVITTTSKKALVLVLVLAIGFTTCSCIFLAISGFFIFKYRVVKYRRLLENGNLGFTEEITLRSFSYNELKKATNGFKEELGRGSFGAVYKGMLNKKAGGKLVAVKRLEKVANEGEREFQAEMRVIGKTHHRNLVRLLGYCAEDSKRLLVYEYMRNGSLADLLFRAERRPDWNERVRIALDVARGILYLHEECEMPTIHCDIKPQNILMDDFWTAKISDFGLAKLLMPDQTRTITDVRGTRGYLAPEWQKNSPISVKADIYGYGIVLLEIVCCRRSMDFNVTDPDEIVLSNWVYKCFVAKELEKLVGGEEIVDKKTLEAMVKVGLWCIQDEPSLRPSMKSVVLMLEGITDIAIPPCPTSTSV